MKKLLLLDADVVIDLHTLGLFDRINKGFEIHITKTVLDEASYFVEKAFRTTGYQKKNLYPRHWEKTFTECIREGKTLRIMLKKLTET